MADVGSDYIDSPPYESTLDHVVHDWEKKMECNTLGFGNFREFWARNVQNIYSIQPDCDCLNITYDEELAHKMLFEPLEVFICGSKETEKVFEHVRNIDTVSSLCGKVFKSGEPTYSCRDCGLDLTCVLCVDCFKNSAHKHHRYKMSTSGGGGYCDCGDEEAWKNNCFCEIHQKNKTKGAQPSSAIDRLPPDMVDRLKLVMQAVLMYCHQMLTWEQPVNLPPDLQVHARAEGNLPDTYATVLFNDETHTYEQVIETLNKAILCTKKAAIDFATMIDREGRTIVKCSTFASCNNVRHIIERITTRHVTASLKVLVMHTDVVSHQTFAMKLLSWLQKILSYHEGFRLMFSQIMIMSKDSLVGPDNSLLESVMLCDTRLWKSARNQWHQLFISGMLMDQQCKKIFAKAFTRKYPTLIIAFMADDHDHSISVTSLSVQIFTVPTLAQALIEEEDAITVLLQAFLIECEHNKNEEGKLAFQRNQLNNTFRRAHYMLYDLKYLITTVPSTWTDGLRRNFLHGLQSYLEFLNMMQGMDAVVRQVGQHIEYEAEWESGINLQLKIACIATLLIQWCISDCTVFVKALRATLKLLQSSLPRTICVGVEVANHSASCIEYDVSSMPVTVHLPLSRFAAGLLLHLEKFNLHFEGPQFQFDNSEKPSPVHLMELPLRTLVMLAQFRAGMWRRNGYSLFNQVYFYHNVRFRDEMFDRDILMLQIAASMIESNEFLIHLIYKFGLLNWSDEKYDGTSRKSEDDNIRQILTVAEEFLSLLLTIVSERFTPGIGKVTEQEQIKKEIIQLLCIEPMPHSQLFKMLPKDANNETGMDDVANEVAVFRKPQGPGTGKYELKPEYYSAFNPFYYHYTREDQSKAEETQLKRKKQTCDEVCCPPPVPPEFQPRFAIVTNMLQCDVMLHIIHMIFERTLNLLCAAFSEAQFEKTLHIVGVALHEEERFLKSEGDVSYFNFTTKARNKGIPALMEECLKSPRVESHKDLLRWVIAKYKFVEGLRVKGKDENSSIVVELSNPQSGESSLQSRKQKADLAAARKARIMAHMTAMQKNFIKEHADLFKEAVLEDSANLVRSQSDLNMEFCTDDPISIGFKQRGKLVAPKIYTCILCREDQDTSCSGRALVLAAFVQRSTVLSKNRKHFFSEPKNYDPMLLPSDLFCAPHSSTCGHVMHSDCWQKFFESVLKKEQRRPLRFGRHTSFEVEKNEYLCPLCERLSNGVIPMIPPLSTLIPERDHSTFNMGVDEWLSAMKKVVEKAQTEKQKELASDDEKLRQLAYHYIAQTVEEATTSMPPSLSEPFKALFSSFQASSPEELGDEFSDNLTDMMKAFCQTTYTVGLTADPDHTDVRVPTMSWWSCAYTIHSIEWLLREQNKPLFGKLSSRNALCLEAIVRLAGSSLHIFDHDVIRTQGIRLLRYLLLGDHHSSSPCCCMDLDAFSVLVFLVLSMPVLFKKNHTSELLLHPMGSALDCHILRLMFTFHLVQLLLSYSFDSESMETETVDEDVMDGSDEVVAAHFYHDLRTAAGVDDSKAVPSGYAVVQCIKNGTLPFLRCAALFFHTLTDTAAPVMLQEVNDVEFEQICKYLGLPTTVRELLSSPSLKQLALSWVRHPRILHLLLLPAGGAVEEKSSEVLIRHPLSVNHLVSLPNDYSELINSVSLFTCPNSVKDDSRNPTMCLVCGTILCAQSFCCQRDLDNGMVGACTYHAHFCGAGIGIFLRIRDCKVLLLSDRNKGCFMAPPYVDDYGETDQGLYRGNPLHLCQAKYEELNELWLSHNIPEQVSHTMEQSTSVPNWQML